MATIDPPKERRCLRCSRLERWDDGLRTWVAHREDGEYQRGRKYCVHEWDITGNYNPLGSKP